MKILQRTSILLLLFTLFSCQVKMSPGGEFVSNDKYSVTQDGKSLWIVYQDSAGNNIESYGIHKIKLSSYKFFGKTKSVAAMYDLAGNPLNAKSAMGFHKSVTIEAKKGTKITEMFLDENDQLVAPSSQKYAIMTTEHFKDGTWKETYLNENKQPSCDLPVYEKHMKIDTIWNHSEKAPTFELGINVFREKSCKE